MTHWTRHIVLFALVAALLCGASTAALAAPARNAASSVGCICSDYQLWLQDPTGRLNNGRWFLCETYEQRRSAEFVAYLCETRGFNSEIVAVPILNPHFRN